MALIVTFVTVFVAVFFYHRMKGRRTIDSLHLASVLAILGTLVALALVIFSSYLW